MAPSSYAGPLPAVESPIGVLPEYTRHTSEIALRIRERKSSWSGDDFEVKDAMTGEVLFEVKQKWTSLRQTKVVADNQGRELFHLKQMMSLRHKFQAHRSLYAKTDPLFEVHATSFWKNSLRVDFKNLADDGEPASLKLDGDWLNRGARVLTMDGAVVATISRDYHKLGNMLCKYTPSQHGRRVQD